MYFAEKLQRLRRQSGLSQEELAERLGTARQTVSKWENGQATPELGALVKLGEFYGISLDRLVKGEDGCMLSLSAPDAAAGEGMIPFLLRAKRACYAGKGKEAPPSRPGSHDYAYREGDFLYIDTYLGGERFAGEEAVWRSGMPVWSMNYAGRVLGEGFSGDFLKEALLRGTREMPCRGPVLYIRGEYAYHCRMEGDADWFSGGEEILLGGRIIYEARFHGGKIR